MENEKIKIWPFKDFQSRYEVNFKAKSTAEGLLGVGGFGRVFLGYDKLHNDKVAIKRADTDKGLLNEVEMGRKIPENRHIARYLDGFRVDTDSEDYDVAVMQYYTAGNLDELFFKRQDRDYIKATQLDSILKGILKGLAFLHEGHPVNGQMQYYIHRDLKPANILIAEHEGRFTPLITDFGISKSLTKENREEQHSQGISTTVGTINYKAPEQFTVGAKYNASLDLWAFGVMLFKILTGGRLPFYHVGQHEADSSRREVEDQILHRDLEGVLAQVADQPEKYQRMLRLCLVRDYKKRAQSARELIEILIPREEEKPITESVAGNKANEQEVMASIVLPLKEISVTDTPTDLIDPPKVLYKGSMDEVKNPEKDPIKAKEFPSKNLWKAIVVSGMGMALSSFVLEWFSNLLSLEKTPTCSIISDLLDYVIMLAWAFALYVFLTSRNFTFKKKRDIWLMYTAQMAVYGIFSAIKDYPWDTIGEMLLGLIFSVPVVSGFITIPVILYFRERGNLRVMGLAVYTFFMLLISGYLSLTDHTEWKEKQVKLNAEKGYRKYKEGVRLLNTTYINIETINNDYFREAVTLYPDLQDSVRTIFLEKAENIRDNNINMYNKYMRFANEYIKTDAIQPE